MFGAKVALKDAETVKNFLKRKNLMDNSYSYVKNSKHLYYPLKKKAKIPKAVVVQKKFSKKKSGSLRDLLKSKLTFKEFAKLKTAYDVVGSIAILEIDKELRKKEKVIAQALIKSNKSIRTVLRKDASHEGKFRTQKMKFLAGENTKETIHSENNVRLKLDVEKVYFSARLSTERKRIYEQVKKGEDVLVMFSGSGVYPCVISKNTKVKEVVGIEINPAGHEYAVENVLLNKLGNILLIKGDVKKDAPILAKSGIKFDRILMPLPKSAEDFLKEAKMLSKKGTIVHFYNFLHEDEFGEAEKMVSKVFKKWKKLRLVKCGQHAPRVYRICLDFKVL